MTDNRIFWMVWNPQGGAPKVRHATELLALAEAKRLAGSSPRDEFIVLRSVATAMCPTVVLTRHTDA